MTTYRPIESEELMENLTRPSLTVVADTIDVSHWQENIDWKRLYVQGVRNAWIKCTDGVHTPDGMYEKNVARARDAGIRVGSYHFMLPNQEPEAQAQAFATHCKTGQKGDLLHMLDAEWRFRGNVDQWLLVGPGTADPGGRGLVIAAMIGRFCLRGKAITGEFPIIYSGAWWIQMLGQILGYRGSAGRVNFSDLKFWIAAYTRLLQAKHIPAPWATSGPAIWQYSGNSKLSGIGSLSKEVDFDQLLVPVESLCF